jgi:hypothetical protein
MFENRKLFIATKHHKEKVIAPILEKELGVKCYVPNSLDTDIFGTFTGEIPRKLSPLETARAKCLEAMKKANSDLAVASEGSFGPHPSLFFVNADEEILVFMDKKSGLEIVVREISTETNFDGEEVFTEEALLNFSSRVKFPSHGLILRKSRDSSDSVIKGICTEKELLLHFQALIQKYGKAFVETDMRALYNPSRMAVIGKAAEKLAEKILSKCPLCQFPGYEIVAANPGLPCQVCGSATRSILSYTHSCKKCGHTSEELYPQNRITEDPRYCDFCNP